MVVEVLWSYVNEESIAVAPAAGNYSIKMTHVPRARAVSVIIQKFVRERRRMRQITAAKEIMDPLDGRGYTTVDCDCPRDDKYVLRSAQRFLLRLGYKRGKKRASRTTACAPRT